MYCVALRSSLISRGIDDEKFAGEMADAGANLPGHQRILIGGIVAHQQHGFRFVQLFHRQHRIASAIAESGHQAGEIRGAMMVHVVGAERGAGHALEQIIFFVGGAVRADEAEGIFSAGVVDRFELCGGSLCGFFPR